METSYSPASAYVLCSAIASIFKSVPQSLWQSTQELSNSLQVVLYGMGVAYGLLQARQMLGTRGLSQYYPLGGNTLAQTIHTLLALNKTEGGDRDPNMELLCAVLVKVRSTDLQAGVSLRVS